VFDEKRAINRVSVWVSMLRHKMEKEYSREWLETELRKGLREGRLSLTIKAVEAADNGDEIADAALREVGAELQMQLLQKRDLAPGHLQVIAYLQRAAKRAPHKRPRGRRWYDDWVRNIHICLLIVRPRMPRVRCAGKPQPGRAPREQRRTVGISLVVAALARNKIHLDEGSVQENLWFGLPGELVRGILRFAHSGEIHNLPNDLAVP
jgi:hypothetical protein